MIEINTRQCYGAMNRCNKRKHHITFKMRACLSKKRNFLHWNSKNNKIYEHNNQQILTPLMNERKIVLNVEKETWREKKTPFGGGTPVAWKSLNSLNKWTHTLNLFSHVLLLNVSRKLKLWGSLPIAVYLNLNGVACRNYVQTHWQLIRLECNWINMRRKKTQQNKAKNSFVLCSIEMWPSFVHLPIVCVCVCASHCWNAGSLLSIKRFCLIWVQKKNRTRKFPKERKRHRKMWMGEWGIWVD